jgi:hypothetical protein
VLLQAPSIAREVLGEGAVIDLSDPDVTFVEGVSELIARWHRLVVLLGWACIGAAAAITFRTLTTWYELWSSELVVVNWPFKHSYQLAFITYARMVRRSPRALPLPTFPMAAEPVNERLIAVESSNVEDVAVTLGQGPVREVLLPLEEPREFLRALAHRAPHVTVVT